MPARARSARTNGLIYKITLPNCHRLAKSTQLRSATYFSRYKTMVTLEAATQGAADFIEPFLESGKCRKPRCLP
jgi:heme oxygenase